MTTQQRTNERTNKWKTNNTEGSAAADADDDDERAKSEGKEGGLEEGENSLEAARRGSEGRPAPLAATARSLLLAGGRAGVNVFAVSVADRGTEGGVSVCACVSLSLSLLIPL